MQCAGPLTVVRTCSLRSSDRGAVFRLCKMLTSEGAQWQADRNILYHFHNFSVNLKLFQNTTFLKNYIYTYDSGRETQLQRWKFSSRKKHSHLGKQDYPRNYNKYSMGKTLKNRGTQTSTALHPTTTSHQRTQELVLMELDPKKSGFCAQGRSLAGHPPAESGTPWLTQ